MVELHYTRTHAVGDSVGPCWMALSPDSGGADYLACVQVKYLYPGEGVMRDTDGG